MMSGVRDKADQNQTELLGQLMQFEDVGIAYYSE